MGQPFTRRSHCGENSAGRCGFVFTGNSYCHDKPEVVRLIQTSVPAAKEAHRPEGDKADGVRVNDFGNSTAYLAARLKRDRPDLLPERNNRRD